MKKDRGFTLIELLVASGILITIMAAYLDTYHSLFSSAQQSRAFSLALTACISKMEEISSHNFSSIITDYSAGGTPGNTFDITGLTGKGVIQVSATNMSWTEATATAAWPVRTVYTSLVYDNKMWVMGGWEGFVALRNDVWYSTDGANWIQATASANWSARGGHTSLVYDNKMWVMGGWEEDSGYINDVWYSADGVIWTQVPTSAGWSARAGHTSLVHDNEMWVMGGGDVADKNDVWHSADGVTWTQATSAAAWPVRSDYTSLVYDNKMWVMGGWAAGVCKNDVWWTDDLDFSDGQTWTQATSAAAWPVRYGHTSLVYDNKMWVMGGCDGTSYKNDVWYSADGVTWTQVPTSADWSARNGHTSLVHDNKMWVMGGWDGGVLRNDVWDSTGYGRVLEVWIRASFKTPDGRIIGEDKNFDGNFDVATEDTNGNGIYDTPVQIRALISANKKEIFLGRQP